MLLGGKFTRSGCALAVVRSQVFYPSSTSHILQSTIIPVLGRFVKMVMVVTEVVTERGNRLLSYHQCAYKATPLLYLPVRILIEER